MVRSFNLSNYKNSIWKGREYAHLWYKKTKTILVEGTVVWWWQILNFFSDFSPSTIYADQSSFSIILFLGSPFLSAASVCFGFLCCVFFYLFNKRFWVFLRLSQNDASVFLIKNCMRESESSNTLSEILKNVWKRMSPKTPYDFLRLNFIRVIFLDRLFS